MANSTAARLKRVAWVCLLLGVGCTAETHQLHYLGDKSLTHYTDVATQIDYPNVESDLNPELTISQAPRTLGELTHDEVWELSLAEAIQIALTNNEIIRRNGGIVDTFDSAQSIYDSAIQETQPLFGVGSTNSRGIEDALSDFDAQFSTNMLCGRSAEVSNSFFTGGGLQNGLTLTNETGAFESRLQKTLANSGIFALQHDWDYSGSNTPSRLFPSVYTGFIRAEYRQPLLAGSGTEFTRIAGPRDQRVGVNRGVLIARINQDLTLADFEARVTDLLKEIEDISKSYK